MAKWYENKWLWVGAGAVGLFFLLGRKKAQASSLPADCIPPSAENKSYADRLARLTEAAVPGAKILGVCESVFEGAVDLTVWISQRGAPPVDVSVGVDMLREDSDSLIINSIRQIIEA